MPTRSRRKQNSIDPSKNEFGIKKVSKIKKICVTKIPLFIFGCILEFFTNFGFFMNLNGENF